MDIAASLFCSECPSPTVPLPPHPGWEAGSISSASSLTRLSWRVASLNLWWILTCLDLLPPSPHPGRSPQTQSSSRECLSGDQLPLEEAAELWPQPVLRTVTARFQGEGGNVLSPPQSFLPFTPKKVEAAPGS